MTVGEEKHFWCGQDLASSEVLELGDQPKDVQMEEVGKQVMWGPVIEPPLEGLPLAPLTEVLLEETGATAPQEGGTMADNDATA